MRSVPRCSWLVAIGAACATFSGARPAPAQQGRRVVPLDGTWEIAEGSPEKTPQAFDRRVRVPGLADMAQPAFAAVGDQQSGRHRQAFWYRRTFAVDGPIPAVARLKIRQAMFGARVFVNGQLAGDHLPCFTSGEFDVRKLLKGPGETNELVIRVGAHRSVLPKGMPDGFDFEKIRYIPGIFDSVDLILCGTPRVANVQAVPDLEGKAVRVVAEIDGPGGAAGAGATFQVREAATGNVVGSGQTPLPAASGLRTVDVRVPIQGCRFWSPEDPFLYELDVSTGADTLRARFGMRSFRFDPKSGKALLNGKPYPLRGTNVCVFRFAEDPSRGDRPWREEWVRRLHRAFRSMHWNSIRYCIGFPPELWYRIADEEGLMIQDEFPIWYGGQWPPELKADALVKEYTEWMRERWNHPCVVIWDAQNESITPETGKAIAGVRRLDLSDRPWDNGWSPPASPGDCYEAHPYAYGNPAFRLSSFAKLPGAPGVPGGLGGNVFPNTAKNPVIINEYGWLWLNRDGSATTLSKKAYETLLGPDSTAAQRRELYARLLAAKTEFWRCRRQVAGVLHFCGLGYSRPDGQTSDNFLDIEKLNLEPSFQKYVGDAFSPVGLMVDFWDDDPPAGKTRQLPVVVINDLYAEWQGSVRLRLLRDDHAVADESQPCRVAGLGTRTLTFAVKIPAEPGRYRLVAGLVAAGRPPVESLRDFAILTEGQRRARDGIAKGRPVTASSSVTVGGEHFPAQAAVDGDPTTRWSSEFSDPQWIAADLGRPVKIARVELVWEAAYGKSYTIDVSPDGKTWKTAYSTDSGKGGSEVIRFAPVEARWVRMHGAKRGTPFGYSLWEFKVFGE